MSAASNVQPVGAFVVRSARLCAPGRYTLTGVGRWIGPDDGAVRLLNAAFNPIDHLDAVSAAAEQFAGQVVRPVVALSA